MARILLVISGGIAAYKMLEVIRRLRERGHETPVVMTDAATRFVTPLSVGALSNAPVLTDLFDLDREREIGHIRLARSADLVLVAPASADLLSRMAAGQADDLATATLLATGAPVLAAPAMNPHMWAHPATARNVARLAADGVRFIGPEAGEMAERGEAGVGRLAEPAAILAAIDAALAPAAPGPLAGRHAVVTSGPTHEPIDPVRYIANRSSGRQGHAIAAALAAAGARVTLVSGPVTIPAPAGVDLVAVESARDMLAAVEAALPADIAVMAAAVADFRVDAAPHKMKKTDGPPVLTLTENPDILATVSASSARPRLVVGFAAETQNVVAYARDKLARKGCDWIVANDVSADVFGGTENTVHLVSEDRVEDWPRLSKEEVGTRLVARIAETIGARGD
ncbi:bifunctional phosphopantothenoylcysteine decarboxylase/phosphopantothenate--cysteine ligase CoaBC [Acuticoccus sp. I52.16.1]|uniref:bifunctional phosphopantothenoylcysteine decarboxylase/phosphopantothenate--cysteine ligase CoaBC n=1 Tax=Acuticoccus sp. I52.16.1 TaxID=2928472 RepID=UPI001FD1F957|nr:bifunctional phosphopantothenoylcysteine decarboxylase/phosphopantothenate--cysteine ligase CoaBC [Acuticoccus sp. I52.16.1]UOM36426.1 bifunctional phosphopantothenoylcysteine decarboxylase/phosphopantothenate--cysteine ligase CoaBC [Acuticoccus sp. I52.16.1]